MRSCTGVRRTRRTAYGVTHDVIHHSPLSDVTAGGAECDWLYSTLHTTTGRVTGDSARTVTRATPKKRRVYATQATLQHTLFHKPQRMGLRVTQFVASVRVACVHADRGDLVVCVLLVRSQVVEDKQKHGMQTYTGAPSAQVAPNNEGPNNKDSCSRRALATTS
eukprot:1183660-Prorocentrum_minimum.AAC.3